MNIYEAPLTEFGQCLAGLGAQINQESAGQHGQIVPAISQLAGKALTAAETATIDDCHDLIDAANQLAEDLDVHIATVIRAAAQRLSASIVPLGFVRE